jgi:hypothetical protein
MSRVGVWMTHYSAEGSNNERALPKAIESVLSQSFTDLELLIFDNHSPGKAPQIIAEAASRDARTIKIEVPKGIAGIPMAKFAWELMAARGYDYTITIGGHDFWNGPDFLKTLVERMELETEARKGNPDIAIVYADTLQVDEADIVCGRFQNILQVGQIPRQFIPQYVLTGLDSPPFFGLWNEKVRRNVPVRYECAGFDHFVVMHATLKGMLLYEGRATLVMRAPPGGDGPDKYGQRHLAKENLARGQQDFIDQLEWAVHCIDEALVDAPAEQKATMRMMLTGSMFGTYLILRPHNLFAIPDAYAQFTSNPLVIEAMKGLHHTMRFVDAMIKTSRPGVC